MNEITEKKSWGLAPMYKRSIALVLLGAWVVVGFKMYLEPPANFGVNNLIGGILFLMVTAGVALFLTFNYKVTIDGSGITQKFFFTKKHFPWEWFREGKVHRGPFRSVFEADNPKRKDSRLALSFSFLKPADIEEVLEICLAAWTPPLLPEPPDKLEIRPKFGSKTKGKFTMTYEGIEVRHKDRRRLYLWNEIQDVQAIRLDHHYQDFRMLRMAFPEKFIELKVRIGEDKNLIPDWKGANAIEILEMIKKYAPDDVMKYVSMGPKVETSADLEFRKEQLVKSRARETSLTYIITPIVAAGLCWFIYSMFKPDKIDFKIYITFFVFMFAMMIFPIGVAVFQVRAQRKTLQKIIEDGERRLADEAARENSSKW